ncbi:MAG: helix-turn-helix domain-containing protein [Phycisphaerae bacterium]|jgi:excisionase family DNA binding protein
MTRHTEVAGEPIGGVAVTPELLDVHDVAAVLGCSTRSVCRLAGAGKLPSPVKLGRLSRWRRAELLTWLAEGCPAMHAAKAGGR